MKRENLSPRYNTSLKDIPGIKGFNLMMQRQIARVGQE
ncbi:DUF4113 domain-containing protein [Pantoea anthophila]|nr:DUF4113 domain-containing protein [uncultured Pantoea sp.]